MAKAVEQRDRGAEFAQPQAHVRDQRDMAQHRQFAPELPSLRSSSDHITYFILICLTKAKVATRRFGTGHCLLSHALASSSSLRSLHLPYSIWHTFCHSSASVRVRVGVRGVARKSQCRHKTICKQFLPLHDWNTQNAERRRKSETNTRIYGHVPFICMCANIHIYCNVRVCVCLCAIHNWPDTKLFAARSMRRRKYENCLQNDKAQGQPTPLNPAPPPAPYSTVTFIFIDMYK